MTGQNGTETIFGEIERRMMIPFYVIVLLTVIGIIPNVLMIIALVKTKRISKTSGRLFVVLCVADISCLALYTLAGSVMFFLKVDHSFYWLQMVITILATFSQIFGIELFLLITILRCRSLLKPLSPKPTGFIWRFLVIASIVSISCPTVFHLMLYFDPSNIEILVYVELFAGLCQLIVIFLIVAFNFASYYHLSRLGSQRNTSSQQNSDSIYIEEEKSRKRKLKSVNTLLIITFFYVLCYLPSTIRMVFKITSQFSLPALLFGIMMLGNSSFNSIIYIVRTKNMRTFYGRLFIKYIYRR